MGLMYVGMGGLFTFLAVENAQGSIWEFSTILLMLIATFNFSVAVRFFILEIKIRKIMKKKK